MWVTKSPTTGKKTVMEDIAHCFLFYPQFQADFAILSHNGVIRRTAFDQYEWTKSKTSLAEYFKWIGNNVYLVPGGFWAPVEKVFKINKGTLRRLAGGNANPLKPEESGDFKKIKKLVERYRKEVKEQEQQEQKDREIFDAIKTLVDEVENAKGKDIEKTREALKKIKTVLA